MNKELKRLGIWMIATALIIVSCGEDKEPGNGKDVNEIDNDSTDVAESPEFVRLPTPTQFFDVIAKIGGDGREDLVNPVSRLDEYTTTSSQALNFGVYFADLAYLMKFQPNKSVEYFEALKDIADKLSVSAIFSEEVMNKMGDHNNNKDSVYAYSNEVYRNAYSYLEDEQKGDILSQMLIGGWVESMYIVTGLVGEYEESSEIINEIAQQNVVLESIYEHAMIASLNNPDLERWVVLLEDIKGVYDAKVVPNATTGKKNEDGVLMISGGSVVKLDEVAFGTIVEKVKEMRSMIVDSE